MQQYLDLMRRVRTAGRAQGRPHRHRHAQRVRASDALRPRRGLPPRHHQEAAPQVDHPRADLVPGRRHQHRLPREARRDDLERVGRRERRPRPRLRQAVALLGEPGRADHRPDHRGRGDAEDQSRQPAHHRDGLEPGRHPRHGAGARATACSSSMSPTGGSPASSTSARPTCSSACRSTSPATRC